MNLGHWVVKHRHAILTIALILLIPSFIGMQATKVNYDMLYYLPSDIETMKGQDMLMEDFGKGGFSLVIVENMKTDDVKKMKADFEKVEHVDSVINLQSVINPSIPLDMYPDEVQDNLTNPDATMLVVFFDTSTSDEKTMDAVAEIRRIGTEDCYVSGMTALVLDLKNLCLREEAKYVAAAVILSLIAMMLLVDSYLAPLLFLASIGCAILYNLGSNIVFGEISFITKAIAAVLQLGVTMDYSIFLWHSFEDEWEKEPDPHLAMERAINETLTAVTGSSITTVAGFLALCFMTYTMGKDLGLVMAKGVVFGVICSVTVLPVFILRFRNLIVKMRHRSVLPNLDRLTDKLTKKYVAYIAVFAILVVPAVYGYQHTNITYDFTTLATGEGNDLAEEDIQFLTANNKLHDDFGIATSYIIIADADMDAKTGRAMSKEIEKVDGVKSVLGIDNFVSTSIPRNMLPDEVMSSLVANGHQMILVNGEYKVSTDECNAQIDAVDEIVHKYDKTATVIGEGPATKDLINMTSTDFTVVSWISIALVFLIIFFVLRSWTLPFILISVIELAIYINLGISGFTGLELTFIVPIIISTIQLGSTVDYAILFSTNYKKERMGGLAKKEAIDAAARTSVPSILVSAIAFFTATFGVSVYSNIAVISTVCTLMARGAVISMITVIFLLPSMLMAFDHIICRTTKGMKGLDYGKEK